LPRIECLSATNASIFVPDRADASRYPILIGTGLLASQGRIAIGEAAIGTSSGGAEKRALDS
jgi:hypothetical protein